MALYRPEAFEPLTDEPWNEGRVRAGLRALVADAEASFDQAALWAPVEDWDAAHGTAPLPVQEDDPEALLRARGRCAAPPGTPARSAGVNPAPLAILHATYFGGTWLAP